MANNKKMGARTLWMVLALGLAAVAVVWYASKPVFKGSETSPMNVYRVEFYDASPIQRILHYKMKIPSFVRLYRIQPETLLGESEVVDLWMNGTLHWWTDPPAHAVVVGSSVVFENIPAECPAATGCPR
ncbi:hypothetical protein C8241_19065 [Paracidovorax avenae]|uniref:hypothetical protein n=1 Tax=Paracidovorax avenae TaxID=80867 RepID=UPI000D167F3F|nr:hypothetical protein [Paracidovorax avenae]AVS63508.1 hypothetical protein C8241_19065 [Paracidovorax avenae]